MSERVKVNERFSITDESSESLFGWFRDLRFHFEEISGTTQVRWRPITRSQGQQARVLTDRRDRMQGWLL